MDFVNAGRTYVVEVHSVQGEINECALISTYEQRSIARRIYNQTASTLAL